MRSYVATAVSRLLSGLGLAALLTAPVTSHAHANLITPPPRDNSSGYKDPQGPCGPPPRTAPTMYSAGQKLTVTWEESVYHPGCYLIDFSPANDQNWQILATLPHAAATSPTPIPYSAQVTLPEGVTCTGCTLRVRQLMLGSQAATCPPATIQPGDTYYSCADIAITGTQGTVDLGPDLGPADASAPGAMGSGCHAAPGVTSGGVSGLALLALGALTILRRRRAE